MARASYSARRPVWLRIVVVAVVLAAGYFLTREREQPRPPAEKPAQDVAVEPRESPPSVASAQVDNVVIRDLEGRVVFRGTIDLQETLERIAQGRRLEYRNDGSTFANREGRLPRKPAGYYKEYVHPTPEISGPGPQRIVVGAGGEAYYTPDHYRTFEKLR